LSIGIRINWKIIPAKAWTILFTLKGRSVSTNSKARTYATWFETAPSLAPQKKAMKYAKIEKVCSSLNTIVSPPQRIIITNNPHMLFLVPSLSTS